MKIYYSAASPFVRKCLVTAHELGLAQRIELLPSDAHPVNRSRTLTALNPLGQVPTLETDDGALLYDSRVICEYLNALGGGQLLPATGPQRWKVLTETTLADGLLDAALLMRYESALRPPQLFWEEWMRGQTGKISDALDWLEANLGDQERPFDQAMIAFACALGYLDFRFPDINWRATHPRAGQWFATVSRRPSMAATAPPG